MRDRVGVKLDIKALIAASAVPPHPESFASGHMVVGLKLFLGTVIFVILFQPAVPTTLCVLSPVSTIRDATTGGAVQSVSDKQLSPNSLQHPALVQTGSRSPCFIVPSRADLSATKCAGFS